MSRVLVIEPDDVSARLASEQLNRAGHSVARVMSGQQAVDQLDESAVDCIVLEPQLGVHNGIEFLYELRSYGEWSNIPVVVWTVNQAMVRQRFQRAWQELGVDAVLCKPDTSLARLEQTITNHISQTA